MYKEHAVKEEQLLHLHVVCCVLCVIKCCVLCSVCDRTTESCTGHDITHEDPRRTEGHRTTDYMQHPTGHVWRCASMGGIWHSLGAAGARGAGGHDGRRA
jgi:hypothetical protein